jgi:hypothetical protein
MTVEPDTQVFGLRVLKCPLGHRSYRHRRTEDPVSVSVFEFRRTAAGDTWHFARNCSQWPSDNFVSFRYLPPEAIVCSECFPKVLVDDSLPYDGINLSGKTGAESGGAESFILPTERK